VIGHSTNSLPGEAFSGERGGNVRRPDAQMDQQSPNVDPSAFHFHSADADISDGHISALNPLVAMRKWVDELNFETRMVLVIAIVAISVGLIIWLQ
jgi:hypothetical protein